MTALRSLVSHHDVTWVASAIGRGRAGARATAGARDERRATGRRTGCGWSPTTQAYDWFYNVVSNPVLWFLQHYLWASPRAGPRPAPRVGRGLRGQPCVRRGGRRGARRNPARRSSSRTITCTSRRASSGRSVRRRARAFRPHPVAAIRLLARPPRADPGRDPRRAARERRRRIPHGSLEAQLPAHLRDIAHPGSRDTDADAACWSRTRSRSTRGVRVLRDRARKSSATNAASKKAARRSSSCASTAPIRRRTSCAASGVRDLPRAASRDARARLLLALLDPSRQDIPEYSEYLGAIQRARARSTTTTSATAGRRSSSTSRTTSSRPWRPTSSSTSCSSMRSTTGSTSSPRRRRS